jgi:hypothetical protein
MNRYSFEVTITWTQQEEADTEHEAREQLKDSFAEDELQVPEDEEIKLIDVTKI